MVTPNILELFPFLGVNINKNSAFQYFPGNSGMQ